MTERVSVLERDVQPPSAASLHREPSSAAAAPGPLARLSGGRLLQDVVTTYVGYLVNALFGFVTLKLMATHLGPVNFGLANLANMFMAVVAGLSEPGIGIGLVRLAARPDVTAEARQELAVASIRLKLLVTAVVCGLAYPLMPWITTAFMHRPYMTPILRACLIGAGTLSVASFGTALFQMNGAFRENAVATAGAGLVRAAVIVGLCSTGSLTLWTAVEAMILMNVVQFAISLYALRGLLGSLPWRCGSRVQIGELLSYTKYLVPWVLIGTICPRADTLLLAHYVDNRTLGLYAAAGQICYVLPMLTGSISLVLLPRISALQTRVEMRQALRRCRGAALLILALLAPAALWGGSAILLIFGPSYAAAIPAFRLLLLAAAVDLALNPLGNFWHALNRPAMLSVMNAARLFLVVLIAVLAIPRMGILGAAVAVIVSTAIPLAAQGIALWMKINQAVASPLSSVEIIPTKS